MGLKSPVASSFAAPLAAAGFRGREKRLLLRKNEGVSNPDGFAGEMTPFPPTSSFASSAIETNLLPTVGVAKNLER
jgi:hypothetical protein